MTRVFNLSGGKSSAPELAEKWIADEYRSGNTFFPDISYEQLLTIAKKQHTPSYLEEAQPAYSCHCN
jgi:hypothetical protein